MVPWSLLGFGQITQGHGLSKHSGVQESLIFMCIRALSVKPQQADGYPALPCPAERRGSSTAGRDSGNVSSSGRPTIMDVKGKAEGRKEKRNIGCGGVEIPLWE